MSGHIDGITKKERTKRLLKLSEELENLYYEKCTNKKENILIEKYENGYSYGHTTNYLYLKINEKLKENEIYEITVKKDMYE